MKQAARAYQGPGCPRCWTPIPPEVLAGGRVYCGECALEFTAAVFQPAAPAVPHAPSAGLPAASAQCARHARNPAVAACERCGAFMCSLCRIEVSGQALCAACFDRVRADGSLDAARSTFRSWRTLGLHLALLGLVVWPLGVLIGPASLYASLRGVAQSRKDGDEGGLGGTVLALLLGAAVTLFGAVMPWSLFSRQAAR